MTLEEVRALVLSFPEVSEEHRRDGTIWRVRRAFFTRPVGRQEGLLVTHVPYEERELLVELDPDTYNFHRRDPSHVLLVVRIATVEPQSLKRLLGYCWRAGASKRAQRAFDAEA